MHFSPISGCGTKRNCGGAHGISGAEGRPAVPSACRQPRCRPNKSGLVIPQGEVSQTVRVAPALKLRGLRHLEPRGSRSRRHTVSGNNGDENALGKSSELRYPRSAFARDGFRAILSITYDPAETSAVAWSGSIFACRMTTVKHAHKNALDRGGLRRHCHKRQAVSVPFQTHALPHGPTNRSHPC
jgi:hypothetical protein